MTVSSTSNKIIYSGNGATTVWSFSFPGVAASDIVVYFTDASGVISVLATSAYSVALTAPVGSNPTGIGGTITYPLTGSPIAVGTQLTILRTLPLTQATSLANQGTIYQSVVEAEMDILLMQIQQLNELLGRGIAVPPSDPNPGNLPTVAQRKLLYAAYDVNGDPIAVQGSSSTNPVSAAMTPVVSAATLAAGRTAFGLGAIATEGIGAGLEDNGAGSVRAKFTPVADSTNQAVVAGFHWTERHATGALTYTCPLTSTLFSGFGFFVYALNLSVTFAINAADAFSGGSTGVSLIVPPGTQVYISTDAAGTWFVRNIASVGLNSALNLQINATVATNAMTIAIKDRNGNDPSTASPILIAFRDPTITGGDPVIRTITSALSIVVPNTATLGTVNVIPNRVWVVIFDNGGTPVLGVILCGDTNRVWPLNEANVASGTAIAGGSNTAGTFYSNGTVTTKSFRIIGFVESTQATAGAWATAPSLIQLFGPGIKKPGDIVQTTFASTTSVGSTTSATFVALTSGLTQAVAPTAESNLIRITAIGTQSQSTATTTLLQIARNAALIGNPVEYVGPSGASLFCPTTLIAYDYPTTKSSTTYSIQGKTAAGTLAYPGSGTGLTLQLDEIQV